MLSNFVGMATKSNWLSVIKKQKVYFLSKSDIQNVIWNNIIWLFLKVVSNFIEKLVIHSSYCEKTIVFCFWTKANYSHLTCHKNESWNQARIFCSHLWRHIEVKMRPKTYKMAMSILPEFLTLKMGYLENYLAHWGQWWLVPLHFFTLFHISWTFFDQSSLWGS